MARAISRFRMVSWHLSTNESCRLHMKCTCGDSTYLLAVSTSSSLRLFIQTSYTLSLSLSLSRIYCRFYEHCVKQALRIEDALSAKNGTEYRINWTNSEPRAHFAASTVNALEYVWHSYLDAIFFRSFSLVCWVISITVVWCEVSLSLSLSLSHSMQYLLTASLSLSLSLEQFVFPFFCQADLSLFALLARIPNMPTIAIQVCFPIAPRFATSTYTFSYSIWQLVVFIPITYIALCAYTSLFQLRLFNYYHMAPHQATDANSLLFSAAYVLLSVPMRNGVVMDILIDRRNVYADISVA